MSNLLSSTPQMPEALPVGVHPLDAAVPVTPGVHPDHDLPLPAENADTNYVTGRPAFDRDNSEAVPTFQRSAHDWSSRVIWVDANSGGTAIAGGRMPGRVDITLAVPLLLSNGVAPLGVVYGPTEADVQAAQIGQGSGLVPCLNPGDSITLYTEASVYVGLIGTNATGAVQVTQHFNPPGGGKSAD
jgi:hypothetical protein